MGFLVAAAEALGELIDHAVVVTVEDHLGDVGVQEMLAGKLLVGDLLDACRCLVHPITDVLVLAPRVLLDLGLRDGGGGVARGFVVELEGSLAVNIDCNTHSDSFVVDERASRLLHIIAHIDKKVNVAYTSTDDKSASSNPFPGNV